MNEKEIILEIQNSRAVIMPSLGALVSRFCVKGREILFRFCKYPQAPSWGMKQIRKKPAPERKPPASVLGEASFPVQIFQTSQGPKRRGGIPILFPNAGAITERQKLFSLKQHGFARDLEWRVENIKKNSVLLSLVATKATKIQYPFDFRLEMKVKIAEGFLKEELVIVNLSDRTLPIAPGFHPYFYVPIEEKRKIKIALPGFVPENYDWARTLFFSRQETVNLFIPNIGKIILKVSPNFKTWAVWSEPDKPFFCLEPWVGMPNAILHPQERINLAPQQISSLFFSIEVFSLSTLPRKNCKHFQAMA